MNFSRFYFFILLFVLGSYPLNGQSFHKVDSLWQEINASLPDTKAHFDATVNIVALYDSLRLSNYTFRIHRKNDSLFIRANEVELVKAINWIKDKKELVLLSRAQVLLLKHYHLIKQDAVSFISLANELIKRDTFYSLKDKFYTYDILSFFYNSTGFYKELIDITPELFEVGRKMNDDGSTKHNEFIHTAMAYYRLKEYNMARRYFKKALSDMQEGFIDWHRASLNNNIGLSFYKEENKDSAYFYYNKGLDLLETFDYSKTAISQDQYFHFIDVINSNIDFLFIGKGNYDKAIDAIKKELISSRSINQFVTEIQAGNKLGRLYYYKKDYANALKYLDIAQNAGSSEYQNNLKIENWKWRSKVLLAQGKQEESEHYYNLMTSMQDSIASAKALQENRIASVLYEVEKKDNEIISQQANIALLDSKNKIKQQLLIFGSIGLIGVFGFVILYRSRNDANRRQLLQEGISQGLIQAQETERSRLARELHDSVGQQLMMLTRKCKNNGDELMEELASSTLTNLRSISRNLHPSAIEQLGFTLAVEEFIDSMDAETDTFFTVEIDNFDNQLDKEKTLHLYRIIQELVANMIKHAQAKSAEISLKKVDNTIKLIVKDSGIGFDLNNALKTAKSLGMKSIEERCKILNAKLNIISKPNIGTKVSITMAL